MCVDTFDIAALGYKYDALPDTRPPRMAEMPTYAMFVGMSPTAFETCSYTLHVFIYASESEANEVQWADMCKEAGVLAFTSNPHYAGLTSIFGGRGSECENCTDRLPFDRCVNKHSPFESELATC